MQMQLEKSKLPARAHAFDLHQAHGEIIQALESEAIEEDGAGSAILPAGLQSSHPGLSHRCPRGTYVSHTVTNREHVSHQSSDGCSSIDHQPKGSHPLAFPLQKAYCVSTLCGNQMATQLNQTKHGIGLIWR